MLPSRQVGSGYGYTETLEEDLQKPDCRDSRPVREITDAMHTIEDNIYYIMAEDRGPILKKLQVIKQLASEVVQARIELTQSRIDEYNGVERDG